MFLVNSVGLLLRLFDMSWRWFVTVFYVLLVSFVGLCCVCFGCCFSYGDLCVSVDRWVVLFGGVRCLLGWWLLLDIVFVGLRFAGLVGWI